MNINLTNMDEFIKRNKCPEVTNAILFNFGNKPTSDGLLSIELFGQMGSEDRKQIFGYIDLKKRFLHPLTYKILISMNRKLAGCINGTKYFSVNSKGEIIEDENGQTGISFLYDNWEKFRFKSSDSFTRDEKILVLNKTPKDILFVNKFLVIPPFIRDFQPTENNDRVDSVDAINDMYSKVIRYCQSTDDFSFNFLSYTNDSLIQDLLVQIYDYCTSQLAKKTGLIHRALLGKSIDYSTRSVISCPMVTAPTWKKTQVNFRETGVPLSQVIVLFLPFIIYEMQAWFERKLDDFKYDVEKNFNCTINHFMDNFDEDHIKKLCNSYIKNHESRFDRVPFKDDQGIIHYLGLYQEELHRNFTITDLLFIVASEVVKTKHVYVTRYPIANFQNIYPSRIKILSTQKTCTMTLGNDYFEDYPLILEDYPDKNKNSNHDFFVDTVRVNSFYLEAMGGDFDGQYLKRNVGIAI